MALLRRHHDVEGTRYRMRERLLSIGDDFWIDTDDDRHAFKVNGKALRIRSTFILEGPSGEELATIRERKLRIRDTMDVERDGETIATVKKALITPLRDRFAIHLRDGRELSAKGNILDHEYEIERDGRTVASVKKALITPMRDRMAVEVEGGPDLDVQGNIVDHEYEIEADGRKVAEVSKRWFRVADTYGVEVMPGQNDVLILAVTAVIDAME